MARTKLQSFALAATLSLAALSSANATTLLDLETIVVDITGSSYALGGAPISIHFQFTGLTPTTLPEPSAAYNVTGLTGTINGQAITGLSSYGYADNLYFPGTLPLD
jgi:hypothetical protein